MTRLEENGRRTGCSGTRSTQMAVRWCITARRNSNALSIRPAANSTDSLPKVSSERLSYPQIPRTRQKQRLDEKAAEIRQMLDGNQPGSTAAVSEAAPRKR